MRAAPLKGDCIICQAPEPTRVAINAAIWPADGMMRSATYRADAQRIAQDSKVPELERLNRKTVARHVEHIEESWREIHPGEQLRADEVPVATDFGSVMEQGTRLGAKAMHRLEEFLDQHGDMAAVLMTKEVIQIAKLGLGASTTRETTRLKKNQQAIDVMAIFAASWGEVTPPAGHVVEEREADLATMRAEIATERRRLTARAGGVSRETDDELPDEVVAAL